MHDGCVLRGTGEVKWPLLQSKLSLERPFDSRRTINYQSFVTSERNVRNANAERYKVDKWHSSGSTRCSDAFVWYFAGLSLFPSNSLNPTPSQRTHTHIMILNPHGLRCKNDWAHFPIRPGNFLYIHTHTRVWASLKCRASSCSER